VATHQETEATILKGLKCFLVFGRQFGYGEAIFKFWADKRGVKASREKQREPVAVCTEGGQLGGGGEGLVSPMLDQGRGTDAREAEGNTQVREFIYNGKRFGIKKERGRIAGTGRENNGTFGRTPSVTKLTRVAFS